MEEEEGTRVADTRISRIPVATSVNRVYRIPDRPINWLTEPGTRLALCNRGAPRSFSFQGVGERQEGERTSGHGSFAYTRIPPSTTCGYERVAHCEYYYPDAAIADLCAVFSPPSPTPALD